MPSRVIHIRLDDWVLLGCHDVMKAGKTSVENVPMATIVRQVVTALVRKLQNTNQIPTYTKEEAYARAMEIYGGAEELDLDIVLEDIVEPVEADDSTAMAALLKETLREIENEGAPSGIAEDVKIVEAEVVEELAPPTLNLFNQDCTTSFNGIKNIAPKDRFIEWAAEQNEIVQQAVLVAYEGLPRALWGTEKAELLIKDLLSRHDAE